MRLGIDYAQAIMIGDQLETDIVAAQKAGVFSVLVETGVPNPANSEVVPDLVVPTLVSLQEAMTARTR